MLQVGKLYCSKNYAMPLLVYTNKMNEVYILYKSDKINT